ncbi:amino acid permease-domain-containing protein [Mortierella sp. GBAus27b]|nr:amino acid permease-domain-containing protein [Mortierella sp. GBAus27b]
MSQPPKKRHAPSSSIGSIGNSAPSGTSSRPKTAYQSVTWKENIDAFNRRLRRGSVSMDMSAQEDELPKDRTSMQASSADLDEHTRLLGDQNHSKLSYGGGAAAATTPATTVGHTVSQNGRSQGNKPGPVFPTQLNPVLATTKSSKLGVVSGVFVPCVLSIWGIILFLRFGFIIGQAGVMGTLGMFIIGYLINIFTTLSLSAISTNGTVRGGGVYYLLSRSLGPEFGGSIGLIYFLCTVIGGGMNVLGFVEPLIANFGETSGTVYRVLPESPLWAFIYGTMLLVSCTLVCLVGAKLFARTSMVLAVIIFVSTLSIFVSFAVQPAFTIPERNIVYTGFSWQTLQENMWPQFTSTTGPEGPKQSFQTVYGVLFPACIGILAGASMSGDLEDPSKSIPKGTLWAVCSTFFAYTCIVILMGGSIARTTMYSDLSVLQDVSVSPVFIAAGGLAASVFATLGSVIGAAKILQAIARDNLLPLLSVFGQGTPLTDEPTLAVLLTYFLSQLCLFLTDMNAIATFVSLITLLTYVILNLACFLLKIGSAPNFRPSFRFFQWWTAFSGMVLSAIVMCYVDLGQSILSGLMTALLFIWIHYWSPPKRWGDVTQSLIYHQVRKYLLRLDSRKEHVKFWRPQILLLVHHPRTEYHLIQFCNHLKKGALYVLGHIILGDLRDVLHEYRRQQSSWLKFVDVLHIKAFVNLNVAESVRIGARNLLTGTGLGGMRPNIVVLGAFNLQRYLKDKQAKELEQQQQQQQQQSQGDQQEQKQLSSTPQPYIQSPDIQKGSFALLPAMDTLRDHSLTMPASLPIDNIRVEAPITITDYVSVIEDVLSLNKAVAIAYGFEHLELPEEHKSWGLKSLFSPSSRPSSVYRDGDTGKKKKKKYIDLWPMQMSIAPMQPFDPSQPPTPAYANFKHGSGGPGVSSPSFHAMANSESGAGAYSRMSDTNLTNFDTYAMVLQMGCILHMVPQWKENYTLRVMVFVEYLEDVEEEEKRLEALLDNLRIPAEIKVMCLDSGDSETYTKLVRGELDEDDLSNSISSASLGSDHADEEQNASNAPEIVAPRPGPWNMNPNWQQDAALARQTEGGKDKDMDSSRIVNDQVPQSSDAEQGETDRSPLTSPGRQRNVEFDGQARPLHRSVVQMSAAPRRRRTISDMDRPQQHRQKSLSPLRVDPTLSPRIRQVSPLASATAHPSSSQYRFYTGGGSSNRLRISSAAARSVSPMESRLGTSVPLGGSMMNFRIGLPLPRQILDPNGAESESDSESSEDDEAYDVVEDDWGGYGGQVQGTSSLRVRPRQGLVQARPRPLSHPVAQQPHRYSQQPPQQQQPTTPTTPSSQQAATDQQDPQWPLGPSTLAHTSLGSDQEDLGRTLTLGSSISSDPEHSGSTLGSSSYPASHALAATQDGSPTHSSTRTPTRARYPYPYLASPQQRQQRQQLSTSSLDRIAENPWSSSSAAAAAAAAAGAGLSVMSDNSGDEEHDHVPGTETETETGTGRVGLSHGVEGAAGQLYNHSNVSQDSPYPSAEAVSVAMPVEEEEDGDATDAATAAGLPLFGPEADEPPLIQFDHLDPETQLIIINELMRIHSSAETTAIVFTTVPAPEEGTSLKEHSSLAYMEKLDMLMEGIDVPVLLLHAKSLTVTMTL